MNILIVGDVHGCLYTFKTLITRHWHPGRDLLIQLGDLINRGNFSLETVLFLKTLQTYYPEKVVILRGNHEQSLINVIEREKNDAWLLSKAYQTVIDNKNFGLSLAETTYWMKSLPVFWENQSIFVSHAGISEKAKNPFDPNAKNGVLWTHDKLRNLGKVQIVGHTPTPKGLPYLDRKSNCWYIDTGVCLNRKLSAIKFTETGKVVSIFNVTTDPKDIENNPKSRSANKLLELAVGGKINSK